MLASALATLCVLAPAQAVPVVSTRVRSAALFKNGLAFTRRTGVLVPGAIEQRLDALPVPAHGSFWIATDPAGVRLVAARARNTTLAERKPALDLTQILRANVGRKLSFFLGEKDIVVGTLLAMPEPPGGEVDPDPRPYGYRPPPAGALMIVETEEHATIALDPHDVRRVVAAAGALELEYGRTRAASELALTLAAPAAAGSALELCYLEHGLSWAPSYSIELGDDGKALLSAQAEVFDEVEDLSGATLHFVTGFPNLAFAHVVDPIALQGDLDAFLAALGEGPLRSTPQVASQAFSNVLEARSSARFPVNGPPPEGSALEDLFFYEVKDVALARGERGLFPLFTARVAAESYFAWDVPDSLDGSTRDRNAEPRTPEIWHCVRLANDSGLPWTSAPAMSLKAGRLLGQDTLAYTAVGAKARVRITRAVDVQGDASEVEVSRERNAAQFQGWSWDRVHVRGDLRVTNYKREAVQLEIEKRLHGEVQETPVGASLESELDGLSSVNPSRRIRWKLAVDAGRTASLGYEYTLFVRG